MIKGTGVDIIEIKRIAKSIERLGQHFLDRLFTHKEQAYCLRYQASERHFAGRFAAKEAISKAIGTGIGEELGWHDVEILNDDNGRPYVVLSDSIKSVCGDAQISVSISHNHEQAVAFAIVESSVK
jgi:holo-[acyl-carrier protein] synthase